MSYWQDEDWIERVLVPVCRDRNFLKKMSGILSAEDFKPRRDEGMIEAYWIAQEAFKFWNDYREPIGGMLRTQMLDYVRENKRKVGTRHKDKLLKLVDTIRHANEPVAIEAIEKKVIDYKQRREKKRAISDLISIQEKHGDISDREFYKICQKALERREHLIRVGNYDEDIEKRIKRRYENSEREFPRLLIEEFDKEFRTFPRGQLGVGLAKYNMGKSTFSAHLAKAYAFQGYKVLFFTLEDDVEMVEDRLDSSLSMIPMRRLMRKSRKLRRRIRKALEKYRGKIKIIDGTDGGMTVGRIEEIWENYRNQGFNADVIIVDYDEGIDSSEHYKGDAGERRESKEIYIQLKKFVSKRQLWGWVLAQTVRGKSNVRKMIVTGDDTAIDISKMRRAGLVIGIGDGPEDWPDDARTCFVAKHRFDKARKSFVILGDYKRAIFYDEYKTKEIRKNIQENEDDE